MTTDRMKDKIGKAALMAAAMGMVMGSATPSLAWGDKEKGIVAGIVGTLIIGGLIAEANKTQNAQPRPAPQPQPVPVYQPVSVYQTPAASAFNVYSDSSQRRIQSTLSAYGYYYGSIDGSFGPATYNATVAYANATGKGSLLSTVAGSASIYDDLLF